MMPDRCDPMMMLNTAKSMSMGGDMMMSGAEMDSCPAQKHDGAATTATNIVMPGAEKPLSTDGGYGGPPADVQRFNGSGV